MEELYSYTNEAGITHIGPVSFVPERADAIVKFFVHFSTDMLAPKHLFIEMNKLKQLHASS